MVRDVTMTRSQLATLGVYATLSEAATAIAAATVKLRVGVAPVVEVAAVVSAVEMGDALLVTFRIAPPTSLTDTVQEHDQYLVFQPDSSTSERRIWQGKWIVTAKPEAV